MYVDSSWILCVVPALEKCSAFSKSDHVYAGNMNLSSQNGMELILWYTYQH